MTIPPINRVTALRWGIVGIGTLADKMIAPAMSQLFTSELVAVTSRDAERADAFAERHGATYAFDDYAAMLVEVEFDAVFVASPNGVHYEHVKAALLAGKHVLVDKPMALEVAQGEELVELARAAGLTLGVGFQARHKKINQVAKQAIAAGKIGVAAHFQIHIGAGKDLFPFDTWRSDPLLAGGGTLLNQGTHAFDLLEYLSSSPIVEVAALSTADTLEEVFAATCRFANGALATVMSDQVIGGTKRDWFAIGTEAWLEGRGGTGAPGSDTLVLHAGGEQTELATSGTNAYYQEVEDFAGAVLADEPFNGTGEDGLRSIVLIEALYTAARTGRTTPVPAP